MQIGEVSVWTRRREEEKRCLNRDGNYEVDKGGRDTRRQREGEVPIMREMIQGLPILKAVADGELVWLQEGSESRQAGK